MEKTLFRLSDNIGVIPTSTVIRAAILATRVLRSEVHTEAFCKLYPGPHSGFHVNDKELQDLLQSNQIFLVDRIRVTSCMNRKSCTLKDYEPWKIFVNPLLLLEMMDRERESDKLVHSIGDNQLAPMKPFDENGTRTSRCFNSLSFCAQRAQVEAKGDTEAPTAKKLRDAHSTAASRETSAAVSKCSEIADVVAGPGAAALGRKRRMSKEARVGLVPSGLSVVEKNVLLLTVLLVHEADHLLTNALSSQAAGPGSAPPARFFRDSDETAFTGAALV
jgi:hypothetical protein